MAVKFSIGQMNRKVIFRAPVESTNDEGGRQTTYPANTLTEFAFIEDRGESRSREGLVTNLSGSKNVYIRYSTANNAINKDYQVEYDSVKYTIHEVQRISEGYEFIKIRVQASV